MLLPLGLLVGKRKDGTRLIFIQYCYSSDKEFMFVQPS